jgi:hypothetical protein
MAVVPHPEPPAALLLAVVPVPVREVLVRRELVQLVPVLRDRAEPPAAKIWIHLAERENARPFQGRALLFTKSLSVLIEIRTGL